MSSSISLGDTIREANSEAVKRILEADPVLVDVVSLGRKERFKVPLSLPKLPTSTYTDQQPLTLFNKKHP